jgi:hypothetical protein
VLPLLTINAPLPVTPAGAMPAGTSSFVVCVGHLPAGAQPAISKLTFATSPNGTTFSQAKVTSLGHGRYRVTLTTPASTVGQQVSIQVHAADAAGGTLTQTVAKPTQSPGADHDPHEHQPRAAASAPGAALGRPARRSADGYRHAGRRASRARCRRSAAHR